MAYQQGQVFTNLKWGTGRPAMVRVGDEVVSARARGNCSVTVADPALLAEKVPDPEKLLQQVRWLATQAATDALGMHSLQAANRAQFTAPDAAAQQALREQLEPKLATIGLQLTVAAFEAIEIV
jgi:membrane protease subunit (stomatin/prohibitin family)